MSGCVFTILATATPMRPEWPRMYEIPCIRLWRARISKFRAVFRVFDFFGPVTRISIFVLVVCRAVLSFEFYQVQTLGTRCTSTSGLKGSQPHFWSYAYAVLCVVLSCCVVSLCAFERFSQPTFETSRNRHACTGYRVSARGMRQFRCFDFGFEFSNFFNP